MQAGPDAFPITRDPRRSALFARRGLAPRHILVVCTRRLGDVLLATPLVRSLKLAWPDAAIDMLVFEGTGAMLENNPDLRRVISVPARSGWLSRCAEAARLWRRYDLACAPLTSDRARFYCWSAGRRRVALLEADRQTRLARFILDAFALRDDRSHTATTGLALLPLLGVPACTDVVAPGLGGDAARLARLQERLSPAAGRPLAVLQLLPAYAYKSWHDEGWLALIRWLHGHGFAIALSGGPAPAETGYAGHIATLATQAGAQVLNLVGQLSLGEIAEAIRLARLYVGPDTSVTHLAAATGTPTVALFGPSDPVRWAPWPQGWPACDSPWPLRGSSRRGNVYVLQGEGHCVPCMLEGCEGGPRSLSDCLLMMDARRVIDAAAELLGLPAEPGRPREAVVSALPRPRRRSGSAA